jgi:hypothetical protein
MAPERPVLEATMSAPRLALGHSGRLLGIVANAPHQQRHKAPPACGCWTVRLQVSSGCASTSQTLVFGEEKGEEAPDQVAEQSCLVQ